MSDNNEFELEISENTASQKQDKDFASGSSFFKKEERQLKKSLEEVDETIAMIREDIKNAKIMSNSNRNRNSSSPYTFLYNMYANLLSAHTSKAEHIGKIVQIKKLREELWLKLKKVNEDAGADDFGKIAAILLKQIETNVRHADNSEQSLLLESNQDVVEVDPTEEDGNLDEMADKAAKDLDYRTEHEVEEDDFTYMYDSEGTILKVSKDMEVLEEITEDHPDYGNFRVVYHRKTGKLISITYLPTNTKLELVEYE